MNTVNNRNISLLFSKFKKVKTPIIKNKSGKKFFSFNKRYEEFGDNLIADIIDFSGTIINRNIKLQIEFNIGEIRITDKLTYIIFECIIYHLLILGYPVQIKIIPESSIDTKGIENSPLKYLNLYHKQYEANFKKAKERFFKQFDLCQSGRYRRWVSAYDSMAVSRLGSDLISLLRNQGIEYSQDLILSLSSTVSEMVGNAQEHGESDCLIDIYITHNFSHNKREGKFGGFNVSILNFSNTYFGDKVKEKVVNNKIEKTPYIEVSKAYEIHKSFFCKSYYSEMFWIIASLQDKVSGRKNAFSNGGKGCTDLIKSVQKYSHLDYCYLMSGRETIHFKKEFLMIDSDGFIGFNKDGFLNSPPDDSIVGKSSVEFPGVAYNLNFILEESNEEN